MIRMRPASRPAPSAWAAVRVSAMAAQTAAQASSAGREAGRILIIDDEPIVREVLRDVLAREAYSMTFAADAEAGLLALDHQEFDLVVLDLMRPGMGGLEALTEIRRRDPDQVVVMLTAFGSEERRVGKECRSRWSPYQ